MKRRGTLKVGAIVELKSGEPKMTITEMIGARNVRCSWFIGSKHTSSIFPRKALQIVGEDPHSIAFREALELVYGPELDSKESNHRTRV